MAAALAPPAGAVTMRAYFLEMSDRDRGVYLTGLMDALRSDPLRESDFVRCVAMQGSLRIHDFLTQVARTKPGTLTLDVAPWFFYAARSLCGDDLAQPPLADGETVPAPDGGPPEVTIAPVPEAALAAISAAAPTPPAAGAPRMPTRMPKWTLALGVGALAAALTLGATLLLLRRRGRTGPP